MQCNFSVEKYALSNALKESSKEFFDSLKEDSVVCSYP